MVEETLLTRHDHLSRQDVRCAILFRHPSKKKDPTMTQMIFRLAVVALAAGWMSAPAMAQDDGDRKIIYKTRTEIDFEGVDVSGELVKPQGALLLDRKKGSFNPLIRLREEFNQEMDQSVNYIR
jgi:hypothetical protein